MLHTIDPHNIPSVPSGPLGSVESLCGSSKVAVAVDTQVPAGAPRGGARGRAVARAGAALRAVRAAVRAPELAAPAPARALGRAQPPVQRVRQGALLARAPQVPHPHPHRLQAQRLQVSEPTLLPPYLPHRTYIRHCIFFS